MIAGATPVTAGLALVAALAVVPEDAVAGGTADATRISVPDGFSVSLFAEDVPGARQMALGSDGTVYVGSMRQGRVHAVVDRDGDGKADKTSVVARNLPMPSGVASKDGSLWIGAVGEIYRLDGIDEHLDDPPKPVLVTGDLPGDRHHGWKFLGFGPDGRLHVPVGAPCNVCEVKDPYGTILSIKPDGTDQKVLARGVRNSVGFDWHPETGKLWFTDNGRDWLGDHRPPDELNHAREPGLHFGFPYCHGGDIPDPEFGEKRSCKELEPPARKLGPHVAAIGMRFYTGKMFPEAYRNQIFVAEHGSWNRSEKIGYRVTLVRLEGSRVSYETFAEGWLDDRGEVYGRPADVLVYRDGSLLVSDDEAGAIYRITYAGDSSRSSSKASSTVSGWRRSQ